MPSGRQSGDTAIFWQISTRKLPRRSHLDHLPPVLEDNPPFDDLQLISTWRENEG